MDDGTPTESLICNGSNVDRGDLSDPLASGKRQAVVSDCDPTAEETVVAYVNQQPVGLVYCDLIGHLMKQGFTLQRADRAIRNSVKNNYLRVHPGGVYALGSRFDIPGVALIDRAMDRLDTVGPYLLGGGVLGIVVLILWLVWGGW